MNSSLLLAYTLIRREIGGRYRGSFLGLLWSLITPLLMLSVYTFVFGTIFKARWNSGAGEHSTTEFAVILFAGLIVFQLFSEVVMRAPTLVLSHPNYVKKVVFPLHILPVVALGSALFHMAVSFAVLLIFLVLVKGGVPWTALLLPLVLLPFITLILGLAWLLASLGVYVRDIGQLLGTAITALMFLSPIFFPSSALPEGIRPWAAYNPITVPVEQVRNVLIFGQMPDFFALTLYAGIACLIGAVGFWWFQQTRKGFSDVL